MRFKILKKPFNKLKEEMGKYNKESTEDVDLSEYRICNKVRWIVTTISKYTPWESLCLVQALTVQKMLKKRNISTTIYLGVNKLNNEMKAHAWIRCGKMYITGGIGGTHIGEAFSFEYDLPDDTAYAETCASIGLAFLQEEC